MSYPIIEIEVTQPLPSFSFAKHDTGIALLLRRKDKPIQFWLEPMPSNHALTPADLARRISKKAGVKLLSEAIREELSPPAICAEGLSLTIAICSRNRPELLRRCLNSILSLRHLVSIAPAFLEIIVVDNAPSEDRTRELVASLPEVHYICEPKPGLDFARNRALHVAQGEWLAFLDDDVTVDRGWLAGLMEARAENPEAAAITGLILPYELATNAQIMFEQCGGFRHGLDSGFEKVRFGQSSPGNSRYPCEAGVFGAGANMAFRRDILLKLGGFDEALDTGFSLPGGGDLDIFYRMIRAGYPLAYEPRLLIFHQHRSDIKALRRQKWSWGLGFMAFVAKSYRTDPSQRPGFRRVVRWWITYQLGELLRSATGRHAQSPMMILAELWGGVIGLSGEYTRSLKRIEHIRRRFA